jgi:hypothetical protein
MGKKIEKVAETKTKKVEKVENKKDKSKKAKENTNVAKPNKADKKSKNKENKEEVEDNANVYTEQEESNLQEDIKATYSRHVEEIKDKLQLDKKQVQKAVKCLKTVVLNKYKDNTNLLADEKDEFFYLNFIFSKLPFKYSVRPINIPLPNSLYDAKFNTRVCLFVKDPRSDFKDLEIEFPFKVKVLDIQKLKIKYSRFQDRRNLIKQYDLFLCDFRIYMLLKKLLGKPFYAAKKYPQPIKLDYSNKEQIVTEVVSHVEKCTTFYMTHGPNYSVKIARVVSAEDDISDNVMAGVTNTLPHILKWGINFDE